MKQKIVNDFSNLKFENENEFVELCKAFVVNGGNLDNPIYIEQIPDRLYTLSQFIKSSDKLSSGTIQKIIDANLIGSPTDFVYDKTNNTIYSSKEYNVYWYRDDFDKNKSLILNSFKKLLTQIGNPRNYVKHLKDAPGVASHPYERNTFDAYDALILLTTIINRSEIYDLLFQSYPEVKELFKAKKSRGFGKQRHEEDYFFAPLCFNHLDLYNHELALTFLKHDIITNEFKNENKRETLQILRYALSTNNKPAIKKLLDETDFSNSFVEKSEYYESPYAYARDEESVKMLLAKGIPTIYKDGYVFLKDNLPLAAITSLLKNDPQCKSYADENPQIIFKHIEYSAKKDNYIEFIETLVKEHSFPIKKYDFLHLVCNKNRMSGDLYDYDGIKNDIDKLIPLGVDLNNNTKFCEIVNRGRDNGLKLIRNLKKNKTLDIANPNFLFNFFNQDTSTTPITKIFHDYFEKIDKENYQKLTQSGVPAWWAGNATPNKKFLLQFADLDQTDINGKPYYFYVCEEKITGPGHKYNSFEIINDWIIKKKKKDPEALSKINWDYKDNNGDNMFHHVLSISSSSNGKGIDFSLLSLIKANKPEQYYEMFFQKNNDGIAPLDIIINSKLESNAYQRTRLLTLLTEKEEHQHINYTSKNKDGMPYYILIAEHLDNEELKNTILTTGKRINLKTEITEKISADKPKVKI